MGIGRDEWRDRFLDGLERARRGESGTEGGVEVIPAGRSGAASLPGSRLHYHRSVTSTNDLLRREASGGAGAGTVVIADEQVAGRGRHGRTWFSPPGGGRYCSMLLSPGGGHDRAGWVTLAAALALVRSARTPGVGLRIKWPNDLVWEGRKIAGVLAEMTSREERVEEIVLGTGINLDWSGCEVPTGVRERGGTLSECAGRKVDGDRFIADYLWEVWHLIGRIGARGGESGARPESGDSPDPAGRPDFASEVLAHLDHLGEEVSVRTAGGETSGICTGLTREGYLELDGGRRIVSGELITPL